MSITYDNLTWLPSLSPTHSRVILQKHKPFPVTPVLKPQWFLISSLHMLLSVPGISQALTSFRSLLRCYLLSEAYSDQATSIFQFTATLCCPCLFHSFFPAFDPLHLLPPYTFFFTFILLGLALEIKPNEGKDFTG